MPVNILNNIAQIIKIQYENEESSSSTAQVATAHIDECINNNGKIFPTYEHFADSTWHTSNLVYKKHYWYSLLQATDLCL